jgi:hypothetical protein
VEPVELVEVVAVLVQQPPGLLHLSESPKHPAALELPLMVGGDAAGLGRLVRQPLQL